MSPPGWLPPVNSPHEYEVITEAGADLPDYNPCLPFPLYAIKIIISIDYKSANERSIQGFYREEQLDIPLRYIGSKSVFTERVIYMLASDETLLPFDIDIEGTAIFAYDFACWTREQLSSIDPASYNILPFTLEIRKEVKVPDSELKEWNSWYDDKKKNDPNFEKDYKEAISRPRTIEELTYETSTRFGATSPSCIRKLEVVRLEGCSSNKSCPICLEDLVLGSEVTRLHCYHVFHGDCIRKWLQESHMCPLCRSECPCV
ncbi:E3 ubiquitin-protein ligase Praja-2-like [Coffea eugenioides]|uniref:E3 ubiquitin-protein ligase Praja-2-like n=1 Tax=Coffea eugenioides TaxID=49369 RepID=UPI000F609D2C|nr:E3 ubiquitin-protein ligase Praja-2-like [Coffea eugenioides]